MTVGISAGLKWGWLINRWRERIWSGVFALCLAPVALAAPPPDSPYPETVALVKNTAELEHATSSHSAFIVAQGELAQQIITALNARPTTKGNLAIFSVVGIPGLAIYYLYNWFNEMHGNIESACEVSADEVYFVEKDKKYVCENETLRLPK